MPDRTILDLFRHDLERPRREHCLHFAGGHTRALSTGELFDRTAGLADGFAELGLGHGERVIVLCDNRPEWHVVDLAALALGAVVVPVYSTLTPAQLAYQVADSGALAAVAEHPEFAARLLSVREQCPELRHVIQVEGEVAEGVLAYDELVAGAAAGAEARYWERAGAVAEEDLATVVYTSGTTGEPKGVMLTHGNLVTNVREILERIPENRPDDLGLEFLPLCHMIERIAGYCYMRRAQNRAYCSVHEVAQLIATVAPTVFASVPRIFEKVYDALMHRVGHGSALRRALFGWALGVGRAATGHRVDGSAPGLGLRLRHALAERLVFAKIRAALGGRLRGTFCGGAALPLHVLELFHAVGIPIQEAYGLTETSPVITLNGDRPGTLRLGSVGRPLPSYQVRLADDGELLAKGPSVFTGYWNKPEATAEAFDEDGFFCTGDIATIDADGFVFITDRKKDLIVTAGGKNVAPQPIESRLKASPLVDAAVLVGDRRPYVVALFSPGFEALESWAVEHGLGELDPEALVERPEVRELFAGLVEEVNHELARFEQVKRFRVLPAVLSVEGGELTPTLKVKRRVVEQRYAELIDAMYGEG